MKTYFASPQRSSDDELKEDFNLIANNPIIDGLLNYVGGLFAVLNKNRQVVALNGSFFEMLGIEDSGAILGLRLGEAIGCMHAGDMPSGCGTSKFCSTCGAAVSMVSAIGRFTIDERKCAIEVIRNSKKTDVFLNIRCCPIDIEGRRFALLFAQDISMEHQMANLKKVFLHDISNIILGALGRFDLLIDDGTQSDMKELEEIRDSILRIAREISIQRKFYSSEQGAPDPVMCDVSVEMIFDELETFYKKHPAARLRHLLFRYPQEDIIIRTDRFILIRVLGNMITNALEASEKGEDVRVGFERCDGHGVFTVWNRKHIPENISLRIFQRNFSTKEGMDRGLGTFSMKFFGESILKGNVDFKTSEEEGTEFRLTIDLF